ncbi:MAG: hypothetical protein LBH31_00150 [Burkholderiaceae bacterium]|jgi:hypothetical protein|nr:hypothetical protein [Burkholderiaceae bacterium]
MTTIATAISIRLPVSDESALERAARHLRVSKSEFAGCSPNWLERVFTPSGKY